MNESMPRSRREPVDAVHELREGRAVLGRSLLVCYRTLANFLWLRLEKQREGGLPFCAPHATKMRHRIIK